MLSPKNQSLASNLRTASRIEEAASPPLLPMPARPTPLSLRAALEARLPDLEARLQMFPWLGACSLELSGERGMVAHLFPFTSHLDSRLPLAEQALRTRLAGLVPLEIVVHPISAEATGKPVEIPEHHVVVFSSEKDVPLPRHLRQRIERARDPIPGKRVPSNSELFNDANRTLPSEVELLRPLRFRLTLEGGVFDMVVLKLFVPEHKEAALIAWRREYEERHGVRVVFDRSNVHSGVAEQLRSWAGSDELLTDQHVTQIDHAIQAIAGSVPRAPREVQYPPHLIERRDTPLFAIDPTGTCDPEDLVGARRLPGGKIELVTAFIDITPFVKPGDPLDRYAQRIGATVYGSEEIIPTLGKETAFSLAAFRQDEPRAAWVVRQVVDEDGAIESSQVTHELVRAQISISPSIVGRLLQLDPDGNPELVALEEATARLYGRRLAERRFERIEGEGIGARIVSVSMISAKSAMARFLEEHGIPAIYKVHVPPNLEVKRHLVSRIESAGIPVTVDELNHPLQLAGILESLEDKRQHSVVKELLSVFLTRSRFDVKNFGHYALGVDAYIEIKPRDAAGIANQFQLAALLDGAPPLSFDEMERRAARRRRQMHERAAIGRRLRFYERLRERLGEVGRVWTGEVREVHPDHLLQEVHGFTRWAVAVPSDSRTLDGIAAGQQLTGRLVGFSVRRGRFQFALDGTSN